MRFITSLQSRFKFHNRGRCRLNFAAMQVWHSKHCVAIQGAVKFYFYETRALLFQIYARQPLHLSNRIARLNLGSRREIAPLIKFYVL